MWIRDAAAASELQERLFFDLLQLAAAADAAVAQPAADISYTVEQLSGALRRLRGLGRLSIRPPGCLEEDC